MLLLMIVNCVITESNSGLLLQNKKTRSGMKSFVKIKKYDIFLNHQKAGKYYADERYFMAARYFSKAVDLNASSAELCRNYGTSLFKFGGL
jgi:Tfp pilus assembly protein PilF